MNLIEFRCHIRCFFAVALRIEKKTPLTITYDQLNFFCDYIAFIAPEPKIEINAIKILNGYVLSNCRFRIIFCPKLT